MTQDIVDRVKWLELREEELYPALTEVEIIEDAAITQELANYARTLADLCEQQQRDIIALTKLNDNLIGPTRRGEGAPEIGEIEYTPPGCETQQQQLDKYRDRLNELYNATNELMCQMGAKGEVSTRDDVSTKVMDVLHDIDGGVYQKDFIAQSALKEDK